MSGFIWPSRAPQATVSPSVASQSGKSQTTVSSTPAVSSLNSTLAVTSKGRRTTHVQVTQTVIVTPTLSAIASPSTVATPKSRRTTRVQVTQTITITPSASANTMSTSCTNKHPAHSDAVSSQATAHVQATHTTTKDPDVTGVIFTLHTPSADAKADASGPNHPAIIGGIAGAIILVVVALVVFTVFRNKRRAKAVDAEVGSSTNDVINTAKRVRSERHRRNRERNDAWNAVDTIELVHQNNMVAAECRRPSQDPTQLAQAHAWETPFGADNFQSRGPARSPPRIVTQPGRLRSQRASSRSLVSPVDPDCVVREGDVSPLSKRG
jgi:hypothetical protein